FLQLDAGLELINACALADNNVPNRLRFICVHQFSLCHLGFWPFVLAFRFSVACGLLPMVEFIPSLARDPYDLPGCLAWLAKAASSCRKSQIVSIRLSR